MKRFVTGSILALLAACLIGCDKERYTLRFSHFLHVDDAELECGDCHGDLDEGRWLNPGHDICVDCHDDLIDAEEIGPKTCGVCHQVADLQTLAEGEPLESVLATGGSFVHTEALTENCAECHGNIMDEDLEHTPALKGRALVQLRDQAHLSGLECATCHIDMDPDERPDDHDQSWMIRHGALGDQPDSVCSVCHHEDSCRECHQVMLPVSHNNLWRLKTHGIEGAWDRQKCMTCHEVDSCDACHSQVTPRSHNAGWVNSHCLQCHSDSASGTGCALCHEGGLENHPSPHGPGYRSRHCNTCHPGTPQAEACAACHGVTSLSDHPSPHGAGWSRRHCWGCHPSASGGYSCGTCHPGGDSVLVHQDYWPPVHDRFGDAVDCHLCHRP